MKKSIIAAGAASVALAAMPIVGAFALTSVSDSITAVVNNGCVISDGTDKSHALVVAPGNVAETSATESITVVCNEGNWTISAVGAGTTGHVTDLWDATNSNAIATNLNDGSTTALSAASGWAFKVVDDDTAVPGSHTNLGGATVVSAFDNTWHVIPAPAAETGDPTVIVNGPSTATTTAVTTQYRVYASDDAIAGTYTGKVTYTVSNAI